MPTQRTRAVLSLGEIEVGALRGNMEKCMRKIQRYGFCVQACQNELRVRTFRLG